MDTNTLGTAENASERSSGEAAELSRHSVQAASRDLFILRFEVKHDQGHEASLMLPTGMTKLELLQQAQEIAQTGSVSSFYTGAVWPSLLAEISSKPEYLAVAGTELLVIPELIITR